MENEVCYRCPVCKRPLIRESGRLVCENLHSYDLAKSGYVNLLGPAAATVHGDNREMIAARRDFLELGYYADMRETLCREIADRLPADAVLLDAGCGEGYYIQRIAEVMPEARIFGVDLSKDALIYSAKRKIGAELAVASVYHLPLPDGAVDGIVSVFSPFAGEEFLRVLKDGGYLFMVIPAARHLFGLKAAIYEHPYENRVAPYEMDGWDFVGKRNLASVALLEGQAQIDALFKMTPYYYRTRPADREKVAGLERLETEIAFEVLVYRKGK